MALHNATAKTFNQPSPQVSQSTQVDAPIKGIDSRTILSRGDPLHCVFCYNILPATFGMRVRQGYREHAIGLDNGNGIQVGTIITFGGHDNNQSDDRLFAVTNEGIWDVTLLGGTPTLVLDFTIAGNGGDISQDAGWGVYTDYTTEAGDQFIFYADSRNGLFQYDVTADTWSRKADVTGPVAEDIYFVTVHKQQLWFVEENSNNAWYLPAAAISGAATQFFFGSKFKHGGNLAGLFSWSIDGGDGLDDYLVAVGREGDVIPYRGTNPDSADTWAANGVYYIGAVAKGTQFANEEGGDLRMLSSFGLVSMSDLLEGPNGKPIQVLTETLKISAFIRFYWQRYLFDNGWDTRYIPSLGAFMVKTPRNVNGEYQQFIEDMTTGGWGIWRDIKMTAAGDWNGNVYFGTEDLRVCVMDVSRDNVLLDSEAPDARGTEIDWSVLTTFQSWGAPTVYKRVKYVRAQFISGEPANQVSRARYDFDLLEAINNEVPEALEGDLWDGANWDAAIWAQTDLQGKSDLEGGWGMGRYVAIAARGTSDTNTFLIGWDVVWDSGNPV